MIEFLQTSSYIPHEAMTLSNQHFISSHHTKAIIIPVDALPSDLLARYRGSNTNGEKTYAKEFQPDLTV
jgi:predicted AlkP superfamily pyrophosphatase or phosphodiesterase